MSIATTETTITNALLASAATTLAQFLIDHPGPALSSIAFDYLRSDDQPRVLLHLTPSERLSALSDWAEIMTEPSIVVTKQPTYVAITVETTVDDIPLVVWSHLARDEKAAMFEALSTPPEAGESVHLSAEVLRQVAESVS